MTAMNKIISIDEVNLVVTAQPGITWKALSDASGREGALPAVLPEQRPAATLGGWIGTGGTGIGAYKYGTAGDIVRDLEVVLPTGIRSFTQGTSSSRRTAEGRTSTGCSSAPKALSASSQRSR